MQGSLAVLKCGCCITEDRTHGGVVCTSELSKIEAWKLKRMVV